MMSGKHEDSLVFTNGAPDMEWYSLTLHGENDDSKSGTAQPVVSNDEKPKSRSSTTSSFGDYFMQNGELMKSHGIGWIVAALLIVADMAGAGIVALPSAIIKCSFYPGIVIISVMAVLAMLSAILLGKAWVILLEMYPFYRTHCRKPYAEIGYKACGPKMRLFVSIILNSTQFGVSTTFLLLVARTATHLLLSIFNWRINYCFVILAVAATLMPLVMLKSPKDFWQVIVVSTVSTFGAVALICAGTIADLPECAGRALFPPVDATKNLMALGIFLFTFGGHAILPTVQHDMKRPTEFTKSSVLAFTLIAFMTLTVVVLAGVTYGDSLRGTVIESIQTKWIQQLINLMIIAHCFLCFPLMINPVNQEFEELLGISQSFSFSRVLLRLTVMCAITFTAVSVPSFEELMGFFGGSTITLTSMVLPAVFYLYLSAKQKYASLDKRFFNASLAPQVFSLSPLQKTNTTKSCEKKYVVNASEVDNNCTDEDDQSSISFLRVLKVSEKRALLFCGMMCTIGVIAGVTATIMSINSILKLSSADLKPCYFQLFQHTSIITTAVARSPPLNVSSEQLTAFIDNAAIASALGGDDEDDVFSASRTPTRYVNCCGRFQNISIGGQPEVCTSPDLKFYVTG